VQTIDYNASVTYFRRVHEELLILRVRPDFGRLHYLPGQFVTLGLGSWDAHLPADEPPDAPRQWICRAYSISLDPFDAAGTLQTCAATSNLEFYIALAPYVAKSHLQLTPRLFCLSPGRRIHVSTQAHGSYTLAGIPPDANVLFAATGTGEAPHNAMIAELLAKGHRGQISSLVCVRYRRDLAYLRSHRRLTEMYPQYRHLPLTTREPENCDPALPGYIGKQYIQDVLCSDRPERQLGFPLNPAHTHVYLCGNPLMIGLPSSPKTPAAPGGAVAALSARGFQLDRPGERGNIHCERYY
jgi:ferredoxin--NADP+ reductase